MKAAPLATPTALLPSQRIKKKSSAQRKLDTPLSTDGDRKCTGRSYRDGQNLPRRATDERSESVSEPRLIGEKTRAAPCGWGRP